MDPFRLCVALGPVAIYLLLLGAINLARRPLVVSGRRDAAALGLAIGGMVIVGPAELFLPEAAAIRFGPYVWALLIALYALCLVLVLLLMRPRLIVYNVSPDQLGPILADLAPRVDAESRWTGDGLVLPTLGVQLHLETAALLRNVSLAATGPNQKDSGWRKLESALGDALGHVEVSRNFRALGLLTVGVLIVAVLIEAIVRDPEAAARSLLEMLRL